MLICLLSCRRVVVPYTLPVPADLCDLMPVLVGDFFVETSRNEMERFGIHPAFRLLQPHLDRPQGAIIRDER